MVKGAPLKLSLGIISKTGFQSIIMSIIELSFRVIFAETKIK